MSEDGSTVGWVGPVFVRACLLGAALGGIASAGAFLIETGGPGIWSARAVFVATALVAVATGIWAGAPDAARGDPRLSERWLTAAALAALSGSFATFRILYEPILPGPWWQVGSLLFVLALPAYGAALTIPAMLAWGESVVEEEVEPGWGPLGPLALGVLLGAAAGVLAATLATGTPWGPTLVMAAAAILLVIPVVLPVPPPAEVMERDLYRTVSPYSELRVTEVVYPGERQPERRLYLNGEEESSELVRSGAPTLAYIAAAESWLSTVTPAGASFLFLGGGAYTLPRRVAERDRRARIVVVELDPEVTRIAQRYFGLKQAYGIITVEADARAFLERAAASTYDRIYVDVYGGDERLPHSLLTEEAAGIAARALTPEGIVALNVIGVSVGDERRQLWSIVRTFGGVFPNVALYVHLGRDFPDRQNFLLAGTFDIDRRFPERAGQFDRWPSEEWPEVGGTIVYHDVAPPAEAGAAPSRPTGTPVPARPRGQTAG